MVLSHDSVLGYGEAILGRHVVIDGIVVSTLELHVTSVPLEDQGVVADVKSHEAIGGLFGVGTEPLGVGTERLTVVTVASHGVTSAPGENEVHTLVLVVGHAVVVAVDHDTVGLAENVHQGSQLGVVARGDITMGDLQDFARGVGLGKGLAQEFHLLLSVLMAGDDIVGVGDRGVALIGVNKAVAVHDDECRKRIRILIQYKKDLLYPTLKI